MRPLLGWHSAPPPPILLCLSPSQEVGVVCGWHLGTSAGRQGGRRPHVDSGKVEQEARIKEKQ